MECTTANNRLVTLSSAVKASIIDKYEDIGKVEQRYSHWGCRELKLLYNQILPKIPQKILLQVNQSTRTATLPLDYNYAIAVSGINENWEKVPLRLSNSLVDSKNVIDIPCEDACPKCQQDLNICNDLTITEDTEIVVINDTPYNKTIIKKLYPNGDYYLETTTPILNIDDDEVEYVTSKEFITNFDLKPCGCLETTPANIVTIQTYCPDIYCSYYSCYCPTPCLGSHNSYRIFEETGLIQFDPSFPYARVYLEYVGYIKKIKGQFYLPEIAFEVVVEGIKKRAIKDKPNIPNWQIFNQKEDYRSAKRDLQKILGRVSLSQIIQSVILIPKFDIDFGYDYRSCFNSQSQFTVPTTAANLAAIGSMGGGGTGGSGTSPCSIINNNYITINNTNGFTLAVQANGNAGEPVAGSSTYQNNVLIGASNNNWILLAKQVLTLLDGDYTINYATGVIDISPNIFISGDSLIVTYDKNS